MLLAQQDMAAHIIQECHSSMSYRADPSTTAPCKPTIIGPSLRSQACQACPGQCTSKGRTAPHTSKVLTASPDSGDRVTGPRTAGQLMVDTALDMAQARIRMAVGRASPPPPLALLA